MRFSLTDIAEKAGVCKATVSMALADHPRISEARRRQIKALALEMGYQANILARGLAGGSTQTIGILWSLAGPHPALEMQQSISKGVKERGYLTHVADTRKDWSAVENTLGEFAQRFADGIVLEWNSAWSDKHHSAVLKEFPAVVIVTQKEESMPFDQIVHDRCNSFRTVVSHFIRSGRKRLAMIATATANRDKYDAFLDEARARGCAVARECILEVSETPSVQFDPQIVYSALERAYPKGRPPFDALLCNSDEAAIAAAAWLRSRCVKIPEEVALVGFNNKPICRFLDPALASIERRDREVIDRISDLLFSRLQNRDLQPRIQDAPMEFVWRESAG